MTELREITQEYNDMRDRAERAEAELAMYKQAAEREAALANEMVEMGYGKSFPRWLVEAGYRIERYMREKGIKDWAVAGIQQRR